MTAPDWLQIRDIFEQALRLPANERAKFLDQACGDRQEIRAELEKLFEADRQLDETSFLDKPIWEWEAMKSRQLIELPFTEEDKKKYKVLEEIGCGGMGVVYRALSHERQGDVAIKVLQGDLSDEDLRRFEDERKIHVKLDDHQNIVTFLNYGLLNDGHPYFVMKFIKGESLESELKKGALSFQRVVEITNQLGNAFAFAHKQGVIHRDIKPSNIMLSEIGGQLCVKVLDFGIAILRESDDVITRDFTIGVLCTPAYASPEQAEGKPRNEIDHRSDIYSLAGVVYEMLTGKRPFEGGSPQTLLSKRLSEIPIAPSRARPDLRIPETVDKVFLKAMARKPEERYDNASQFALDLENALLTPERESQASLWRKYALPTAAVLLLATGGGAWMQYWDGSGISGVANDNQSIETVINNTNTNRNENKNRNAPVNTNGNDKDATAQPSFDIQLLQQTDTGERPVPSTTLFSEGDSVRWNIKTAQTGYLYIVFKGSSGKVSIFHPNPRESGSYDLIRANNRIVFPKAGASTKFDGQPGNETYYFVLAAQKGEPSLAELEKAVAQKRMALDQDEGQRLINALQTRAESKEPGVAVQVIQLRHQ